MRIGTVPGWLKEPLLHFLLAGGLLFAAYAWLNRGEANEPRVMRISTAEVDWLRETWSRQWQRAPSERELQGLLADHLKEALLAREARETRLDENDIVVRRRLAQKMEFLVQDTMQFAQPDPDVLLRFYTDRQTQYEAPARISFTQLYFKTESAARKGHDALKSRRPADLGDPSMLEPEHADEDMHSVGSVFGSEFAKRVFTLPPEEWHGPIASAYGFHLVRVNERHAARVRPFEEVRAQVRDDWGREQQISANRAFFAGLLKKYQIVADAKVEPLIRPVTELLR